jgi:nitrile hydratase subunit alpha
VSDDHDHDHEPITDEGGSPAAARARALEELLVEKRVIDREEVRGAIDWLVSRSPADCARLVARAWVDPAFRERLLNNARDAALELGLDPGSSRVLIALENTNDLHHLVVCTLCSCYPWPLLGLPPTWYKGAAYRARAVAEPSAVLREFGVELPAKTEIKVWDSTSEVRYLVVPQRPAGTDGASETELAARVTRDGMVGTAVL